MNKTNRKQLETAIVNLDIAREIIENVTSQERQKFEAMGENLRSTEAAEQIERNADDLTMIAQTIHKKAIEVNEIIHT